MFEHFRRLGSVAWTARPLLVNRTGGVEGGLGPFTPPRYERRHVEWRHLLPRFAQGECAVVTLDVAVPMHRVSVAFVERLLRLRCPAGAPGSYHSVVFVHVSLCVASVSVSPHCRVRAGERAFRVSLAGPGPRFFIFLLFYVFTFSTSCLL